MARKHVKTPRRTRQAGPADVSDWFVHWNQQARAIAPRDHQSNFVPRNFICTHSSVCVYRNPSISEPPKQSENTPSIGEIASCRHFCVNQRVWVLHLCMRVAPPIGQQNHQKQRYNCAHTSNFESYIYSRFGTGSLFAHIQRPSTISGYMLPYFDVKPLIVVALTHTFGRLFRGFTWL